MKILFDTVIQNPKLMDSLDPEVDFFYQTLYNFVSSALHPLSDRIQNEELLNPSANIIVNISQSPVTFSFPGYSWELISRMLTILRATDFYRITPIIDNYFKSRDN